jgi:hypothetical protein
LKIVAEAWSVVLHCPMVGCISTANQLMKINMAYINPTNVPPANYAKV